MEKLFLVHLGYYAEVGDGVYESHTNIFVVAKDFDDARTKAKELAIVKANKMHIDGMQMIEGVKGYRLALQFDSTLEMRDVILTNNARELAPNPSK